MYTTFDIKIYDGKKRIHEEGKNEKQTRSFVVECLNKMIYEGDKRVVILKASTGMGKSTHLLHYLFQSNPTRRVICSQVTVINSISIAKYVSELAGMQLGVNVGYTTGQDKLDIPGAGIIYQTNKITTDSFLAPMLFGDKVFPDLVVVIDEAHANNIYMHEQMAYARKVIQQVPPSSRPFFIVQSASIDEKHLADYFQTDYIICIEGNRFPIAELGFDSFDRALSRTSLSQAVVECIQSIQNYYNESKLKYVVKELKIDMSGSILVFVAGLSYIKSIYNNLQIANCKIPVIVLSGMSIEQDPELSKYVLTNKYKIIIATNVVETGYTIHNLSFVIDTLKYMQVYYNPQTKARTFRPASIDANMLQQRKGRVGRTRAGVYIAMCEYQYFDYIATRRPLPNIQTNDLKELVMQIGYEKFKVLKFVDDPTPDQIHDVLYSMLFMRMNPSAPGDYFFFITDKRCKLPPLTKYFVLVGFEFGLRLFDLALLVAIMHNAQELFTKQNKHIITGQPNQLWAAYQYVNYIELAEWPQKLLESTHSVIHSFIDRGYDIFAGKKVTSQLIAEIAVRAFIQNIVIRKNNYYSSLYHHDVLITDRQSEVFVTNQFMDFRNVEPEIIIDLPITPQHATEILNYFCKNIK